MAYFCASWGWGPCREGKALGRGRRQSAADAGGPGRRLLGARRFRGSFPNDGAGLFPSTAWFRIPSQNSALLLWGRGCRRRGSCEALPDASGLTPSGSCVACEAGAPVQVFPGGHACRYGSVKSRCSSVDDRLVRVKCAIVAICAGSEVKSVPGSGRACRPGSWLLKVMQVHRLRAVGAGFSP